MNYEETLKSNFLVAAAFCSTWLLVCLALVLSPVFVEVGKFEMRSSLKKPRLVYPCGCRCFIPRETLLPAVVFSLATLFVAEYGMERCPILWLMFKASRATFLASLLR